MQTMLFSLFPPHQTAQTLFSPVFLYLSLRLFSLFIIHTLPYMATALQEPNFIAITGIEKGPNLVPWEEVLMGFSGFVLAILQALEEMEEEGN
uniref:Uncharacterized protein n=1 Tax=Rhizophora mucronata TaxID=61149 RepID=A0A2P2PR34_RHIMU